MNIYDKKEARNMVMISLIEHIADRYYPKTKALYGNDLHLLGQQHFSSWRENIVDEEEQVNELVRFIGNIDKKLELFIEDTILNERGKLIKQRMKEEAKKKNAWTRDLLEKALIEQLKLDDDEKKDIDTKANSYK